MMLYPASAPSYYCLFPSITLPYGSSAYKLWNSYNNIEFLHKLCPGHNQIMTTHTYTKERQSHTHIHRNTMPASFERNVAAARKNFQLASTFLLWMSQVSVTSGNCEFLDNWKKCRGKGSEGRVKKKKYFGKVFDLPCCDMSEHVN